MLAIVSSALVIGCIFGLVGYGGWMDASWEGVVGRVFRRGDQVERWKVFLFSIDMFGFRCEFIVDGNKEENNPPQNQSRWHGQ